MSASPIRRAIWIVLDGVGAGAAPDAAAYHDLGADTLGNCARAFRQKAGRALSLPTLEKLGLGNLTPMPGVRAIPASESMGVYGRAAETSQGKDTTSGHWEMTGLPVSCAFNVYPDGFPAEIVDRWIEEK